MHELSIAQSIVRTVSAEAERSAHSKVREVRLRVGALAGLATTSLLFCYDIAAQDTVLAGSTLIVNELPVIGPFTARFVSEKRAARNSTVSLSGMRDPERRYSTRAGTGDRIDGSG